MKKDWTKLLLTGLVLITFHTLALAFNTADGYEIKVKLTDYQKDTLFLGYQMVNQSYIRDTATLDKASGFYTFEGKEKLKPGVYLVIYRNETNENNSFQLMISDKEQNFELVLALKDMNKTIQLKNTVDNEIFFNYMKYLDVKNTEAEQIVKNRKTDSIVTQKKLEGLEKEVRSFQSTLIEKNKGTVTSMLLKTANEIDVPEFNDIKGKNERDLARYYYYKNHYFDNFELGNPAMLRSPVLFQRVDSYIEKLTPQHPDSIAISLDRIFALMKPSKETFQLYFLHYFNQYAKSNLVGFDAIYVHLGKKYIETGLVDEFIEKENRDKIIDNANKTFPTIIGKVAPNIKVFGENNTEVDLHKIKAKHTIVFFFAPDCGHCQKQTPDLIEFAKKMQANNIDVKILTVCTYVGAEKMPECWKYLKEKGIDTPDMKNIFINTVDPFMISRYKTLYNVQKTPQLFVLDENKVIRSKSIEAKQLEEVLDFIIKEDAEKLKKGK